MKKKRILVSENCFESINATAKTMNISPNELVEKIWFEYLNKETPVVKEKIEGNLKDPFWGYNPDPTDFFELDFDNE